MKLDRFPDVTKLDLRTQRPDLRRDLHLFVAYVRDRDVKRGHRDNLLPKVDSRRLAKLMSDPNAAEEVEVHGVSEWVNFVDDVALALGFVEFDTVGSYAGYTSQAASFPDNFIQFHAQVYDSFVRKTLAQQELQLLECLLRGCVGSGSEFFRQPTLSMLDRFSSFGSAVGVIPLLDFPQVRRFLLNLLAELPTGEWLSTASLIAFLKEHHPYFLIPKKPQFKNKWEQKAGRYDNFREGHPYSGSQVVINPSDPDAFERVEGRYVERFLEWLPYLLGYVDVAYLKRAPERHPMLGRLAAFRVSERLRRALTGAIAEPAVRVTPAFEVYVQAEVYPARVLAEFERMGELVSADATTVYRLTKTRVAAARAGDPALDAIALLESLATTPLPDNVRRELAGWSEHGEKFVLFTGFSLLETERDVTVPDRLQVECIDPGTYIVRAPDKLFQELERQERVPIEVAHAETAFATLPDGVRSRLRGKARKTSKVSASRPEVTLMRITRVQLLCPDREFLQRLQAVLLGAGCPVEAHAKNMSLVYSDRYQAEVDKAIRELRREYQVTIQDKG